jgi:hypothetical protein
VREIGFPTRRITGKYQFLGFEDNKLLSNSKLTIDHVLVDKNLKNHTESKRKKIFFSQIIFVKCFTQNTYSRDSADLNIVFLQKSLRTLVLAKCS